MLIVYFVTASAATTKPLSEVAVPRVILLGRAPLLGLVSLFH